MIELRNESILPSRALPSQALGRTTPAAMAAQDMAMIRSVSYLQASQSTRPILSIKVNSFIKAEAAFW